MLEFPCFNAAGCGRWLQKVRSIGENGFEDRGVRESERGTENSSVRDPLQEQWNHWVCPRSRHGQGLIYKAHVGHSMPQPSLLWLGRVCFSTQNTASSAAHLNSLQHQVRDLQQETAVAEATTEQTHNFPELGERFVSTVFIVQAIPELPPSQAVNG